MTPPDSVWHYSPDLLKGSPTWRAGQRHSPSWVAAASEGYLGGRLAQAGYPVTLIARGAHLEAIKPNGSSAEGSEEAFRVDVPATFDPREIGEVDFVLFSVELQDTEQAAPAYVHLDSDTVAERLAFAGSLPCEVRASVA